MERNLWEHQSIYCNNSVGCLWSDWKKKHEQKYSKFMLTFERSLTVHYSKDTSENLVSEYFHQSIEKSIAKQIAHILNSPKFAGINRISSKLQSILFFYWAFCYLRDCCNMSSTHSVAVSSPLSARLLEKWLNRERIKLNQQECLSYRLFYWSRDK